MLTDEQNYMKAQIRENMHLKETGELLEIWRQADHEEWTDLAFEVVQEILLERLGEIPAQEPEKQNPEAVETSPAPEDQVQAATKADIQKFLRQETYENMDGMDTEELLEIWRKANRAEWTDMAFEVVRQILMERIGQVPGQEPQEGEPEQPEPQQTGTQPAPQALPDEKPAEDEPSGLNALSGLIGLRCPDCGKTISEQDRVCEHCGADLETPLDETELQTLAAEQLEKAQKSYDQGRNFKSALEECDLALEYRPNSAQAHNLRGLILDALEKTGLAVKEYREAIRLEPEFSEARDNLTDAEAELSSKKF